MKNQLQKLNGYSYELEFRYRGSVSNNTHIKAHSDIDILTIHLGFTPLSHPKSE